MTMLTLQGPSGRGLSFWSDPCRRRALLSEGGIPALSGIEAIDIGTVFHTLLAAWYEGGNAFQASKARFDPEPPSKVRDEALRLFLHYRKDMRDPDHFGDIVAVEKVYGHIVNVKPDLLVWVRSTKKALSLNGRLYESLPSAGVWCIDHKSVAKAEDETLRFYRNHFRTALYPHVLRANNLDCQGYITSLTTKESPPQYALVVTPFGAAEKKVAETWIGALSHNDTANPTQCCVFDRGYKTCKFFNRQCWGF